jgi:hypothetical protein
MDYYEKENDCIGRCCYCIVVLVLCVPEGIIMLLVCDKQK